MLKDLLYALELGVKVVGMFIFCLFLGFKLDAYLGTKPIMIFVGIMLAFVYVIKLLLGVGKHE